MNFTDEQLNAFLDDQLEAQQMDLVRKALVEDKGLGEKLEDLAFVDSLVKSSYTEIDSKPLPQSIVNLLSEKDERVTIPYLLQLSRNSMAALQLPFYGLVALAVILAVWGVGNTPDRNENIAANSILNRGPVPLGSPLHLALEGVPSAVSTSLDQSGSEVLTPILTFMSVKGRYCREVALQTSSNTSRSIACRQSDNTWEIELSALVKNQVLENDYSTASYGSSKAFEQYVNQMIGEDPLSAKDELQLIDEKWD